MNRKYAGKYAGLILAVVVGDILAAALFLTLGLAAVRTIVALPLVLVLPGFAIVGAAFPAGALGRAERLLASLGLSLAGTVLGGLALHLTPWGLRPASWAALLGGVTLGAGGVALLRRRGQRPVVPAAARGGLTASQAALFALAALVLSGALALTVGGARGQATVGFTQLWMVEVEDGTAAPAALRLGVSNREPAATAFRVQFEVDGRVRRTWTLELAPGETWGETVALPPDLPALATLEAVLYRAESPGTVYRRVVVQRGER